MKKCLESLNFIFRKQTMAVFGLAFLFACHTQDRSAAIQPKRFFSELDTFVTSLGNTQYNRYDYYLIQGALKGKEDMKKMLDGFVLKHPEFSRSGFGNYVVYFYLEDDELNETSARQEKPDYRYKIFTYKNDENFVVAYTFRDGGLSYLDWNPKYDK